MPARALPLCEHAKVPVLRPAHDVVGKLRFARDPRDAAPDIDRSPEGRFDELPGKRVGIRVVSATQCTAHPTIVTGERSSTEQFRLSLECDAAWEDGPFRWGPRGRL